MSFFDESARRRGEKGHAPADLLGDYHLGSVVGREADPMSPGSMVCETMRARTAPHHVRSPRNAPQASGGFYELTVKLKYVDRKKMTKEVFYSKLRDRIANSQCSLRK